MHIVHVLLSISLVVLFSKTTQATGKRPVHICGCNSMDSKNYSIKNLLSSAHDPRFNYHASQTNPKQFIDKNGLGGYTFYFDESVPYVAKTAFKRAVNTWVKATGINWTVSDHKGDSLISFKKLSGALGLTYSEWLNFPNEPPWITSLSIEFNAETNWYFGIDPKKISSFQYDFETVALHELGHCFQLNHVSNPNELMYPTTRNGVTLRKITQNAMLEASVIKNASISIQGSFYSSMKWLNQDPVEKESLNSSLIFRINENENYVLRLDLNDNSYFSYFYELSGPDADLFEINSLNGELSFTISPNYEKPLDQNKDNNYEISITAISLFSQETEKIEVKVIDIVENNIPVFTIASSAYVPKIFTMPENSERIFSIAAVDPDGDELEYWIFGGVDRKQFKLDSKNGGLEFLNRPDFENPEDANLDNVYEIQISVSDGHARADFWARVEITDDQNENISRNLLTEQLTSQKWHHDSWLGIFYFHKSNWVYHLDFGWNYILQQAPEWVWLWSPGLQWIATSESTFPYAYMQRENDWVKLKSLRNEKLYYSFRDGIWKRIKQKE
jgi:hypothetical protein